MVLKEQRSHHEDRERIKKAMSGYYMQAPPNDLEILYRDHQVANLLERSVGQAKRLKPIYSDGAESRQAEVQGMATGDINVTFHQRVKRMREHLRSSSATSNAAHAYDYGPNRAPETEEMHRQRFYDMFSGEETFGRFLDLHQLHDLFVNLPGVAGGRIPSYFQFLDHFDEFEAAPYTMTKKQKLSDAYFKYITELSDYLESFMRRTDPLEDIDKILGRHEADFNQQWEEKSVDGWQNKKMDEENGSLEQDDSVWCGDCGRSFSNQNTYNAHLQGKKHVRAAKARVESGAEPIKPGALTAKAIAADLRPRTVAYREQRSRKLAHMMQVKRHDTKARVERWAGMTEREREAERQALIADLDAPHDQTQDEDEGENNGKIYNPLNLPMNWDGKPIPYWLYKLHGLGNEYPCQICGGFVYHGRRAFEKHFGENRHIWGLRCLGITPSATFREVSTIEEAKRLHAKLAEDQERKDAENKDVEQMEDSYGNVMPRKVYNDLLAAGLL